METAYFDNIVFHILDPDNDEQLAVLLEMLTACLRNNWSLDQAMHECDLGGYFNNDFHEWLFENEPHPSDGDCIKLITLICKQIQQIRGIPDDEAFNSWLSNH